MQLSAEQAADLLETSDSLYHREVAALQMECEEMCRRIVHGSLSGVQRLLSEHPKCCAPAVRCMAEAARADRIEEVRHRYQMLIEGKREEKMGRDREITLMVEGADRAVPRED